MPGSIKLCLAQLEVTPAKDENLSRVVSTIEKTAKQCDLAVFPEYCMGYPLEGLSRKYLEDLAEPIEGEFIAAISEKCEQLRVSAVIPIYETDDGSIYNSAIIIHQGKVVGRYRKIHLFDALGYRESDMFRAGSNPVVFKVGDMKVGLVICYDIRFPELIRTEVIAGAQAVIAPSGWVKGPLKEEQWQTLLMARAQENTSYMVGVGNANHAFVGRSVAVDPLGVKFVDLATGDGIGFCEIDDARVAKAREMLPVVSQARKTVYGACLQL